VGRKNRKGRDIGYALAVGSCEKAHGEDACTIAALDATTVFAVPNPNRNLAALSVFSGLVTLRIASATLVTQPYRKPGYVRQIPFRPSTEVRLLRASYRVNCEYCGNCGKRGHI
jgi:hypothetical protein